MSFQSNYLNYLMLSIEAKQLLYLNTAAIKTCLSVPHEASERGQIDPIEAEIFFNTYSDPVVSECITVCFAPYFAVKGETNPEVFIPLILVASLSKTGQLKPINVHAYPYVPKTTLEPNLSKPIALGQEEAFEQYYSVMPPPWSNNPEELTWENQIIYSCSLLDEVTKGAWKWHLHKERFELQKKALIFPFESLETNFTERQINELKIIQAASSRPVLLDNVIQLRDPDSIEEPTFVVEKSDGWEEISLEQVTHLQANISLTEQQAQVLKQGLGLETNQCLCIEAGRGTGKTLLFQSLIAELWARATVNDQLPPKIYWVQDEFSAGKFVTILDCVDAQTRWIASTDKDYQPSAHGIKQFLRYCANHLEQPLDNLDEAKKSLKQQLEYLLNVHESGVKALQEWQTSYKQLNQKYKCKGGFEKRIADLQHQLSSHNDNHRHLQVLMSLWKRQVELLSPMTKIIEKIPMMQQRVYKRLYAFFEKHLPEIDVTGMDRAQMEAALLGMINQSEKKERTIADSVLQIEGDKRQLDLIQMRCLDIFQAHFNHSVQVDNLPVLLNQTLRNQIFESILHYWEAVYLQTVGWDDVEELSEVFKYDVKSDIDYLFVEYAEEVPPVAAMTLLNKTKRVIAMGNPNALSKNNLPTQIDYYLAKHFDLIEYEDDFESLHYQGLLASDGNLWKMVNQVAKYKFSFNEQWDASPKLVAFQNALNYSGYLEAKAVKSESVLPVLGFMSLVAFSEPYLGSRVNLGEIKAFIKWFKEIKAVLIKQYPNKKLWDIVAISTTFQKQKEQLSLALNQAGFPDITITLCQESDTKRFPVVIFLPVYSQQDKSPYNFDKGTEILSNLIARATDHLFVIGNTKIFQPERHSASGHFAKYLFENGENLKELELETERDIAKTEMAEL